MNGPFRRTYRTLHLWRNFSLLKFALSTVLEPPNHHPQATSYFHCNSKQILETFTWSSSYLTISPYLISCERINCLVLPNNFPCRLLVTWNHYVCRSNHSDHWRRQQSYRVSHVTISISLRHHQPCFFSNQIGQNTLPRFGIVKIGILSHFSRLILSIGLTFKYQLRMFQSLEAFKYLTLKQFILGGFFFAIW